MKTKPHGIERFRQFIDEEFVCIGWPGIGDLDQASTDEIRFRIKRTYKYEGHKLGNALGQVNTFVNTMKTRDIVFIVENGYAYVGKVGAYTYEKQYDNNKDGMCHRRSVEWMDRTLINELDSGIQKLISNRNTICKYPQSIERSELSKLVGKQVPINKENLEKLDELFSDALTILEEELKSTDPDRRMKAATELIRLKRN
ncbi:hypothetical protein [Clostridium botulinum]|uniref:hypothetical protein n=1 Tax=Clostridium botulinum TaxID=1491 RepID=UPI001FD69018|nr:hypothetical protein [Clostridium botulinum]MCJ8172687.1 hypothetical protein [Clostridium botulinum]